MATIIKTVNEKSLVTPKGKAHWAKVNTRYDEYEGKKRYIINVSFDPENEKKMKKTITDLLEKAKKMQEFEGKDWADDDEAMGWKVQKDGTTHFIFKTNVEYRDKEGNIQKRIVPVWDTKARKVCEVDIGNGSTVRIAFSAAAYWSSKKNNGMTLYLNKIAVDDLIVYSGGNDFSEFGIDTSDTGFADDDDVPI